MTPPPDGPGGPAEVDPAPLALATADGFVPLGYVREGWTVYLVARSVHARWPTELLRVGRADLSLPDGPVRGRASLVVDPGERARILDLFRRRYGDAQYERWYARPARVVRVDAGPSGGPPPPGDAYYRWLSDEFDNIAVDYDKHITGNRMNRLLRDRSLALLRPTFAGARHLLEIGCGSGMETVPMLRDGHEILAVDISQAMLDVVRAKARVEGLSERLRTERRPARELAALVASHGPGAFDGGYSTYGALNCEPELGTIPPALYALLRSDTAFLAGVYNRWCAFEIVGYTLAGQFARAWGRRTNPVRVGASRFCVDVYAHSVGELVRQFRPGFLPERVEGTPVFLPPSDLAGYAERFAARFDTLARWDARLGARYPFSHWGDHFLLLFRRRAGAGCGPPGLPGQGDPALDPTSEADGSPG
ncbi:MAG: methyltransferase domain-containing protein [Thermoplasmata archaeon]